MANGKNKINMEPYKLYTSLYKLRLDQQTNKYCGETARGAETLRRSVEKKHRNGLTLH